MALVITGARAIVKIQSEFLAFCAGVSITHENRLEEIPQLDDLVVAEYAENGHRCSITLTTVKLASDANLGGTPINNPAAAFNLDFLQDQKKILLQPELIIEIVDELDKGIYVATGCKFEGGTGQLDARGFWQGQWNFKARQGFGI